MRAFCIPKATFLVKRRRASDLDARDRGVRSVPQAVRAKRVRPFHIKRIRARGYVHNHACAYKPYPDSAHTIASGVIII